MKNSLKELLKNVIPVLVGVLLALLIDNWNEERKDQQYIQNFYASLRKEFRETDREITEKSTQQQALLDTIDHYLSNETIPLIELISKGGGLSGPDINLNYWNALSKSKLELIEYEKISILSDIEKGSEFLLYQRDKIIDFVYANVTKTGSQEKLQLKLIMMQIINTQNRVQTNIRKILDE